MSAATATNGTFSWASLLGDTLQGKDDQTLPTDTALSGKVVGLYFSAHWCGPCRGFTPELAKAYTGMKAAGKNLEIVFVSSDKNEESFDDYFHDMPWLALPFSLRDLKASLSKKYKVRGIPTLVLIDENGKTITKDGRSAVTGDPEGRDFPWRPKSVAELLGTELTGRDGPVPTSSLAGKKLALYFSAHWCPPCRGFTPTLVEVYNAMKAAGREDFEFIFVSSDQDDASFNEYFGEMPWLALPFSDRKAKGELSNLFEVQGIPTLITLDEERNVINKSARGPASTDKTGANFPWYPAPLEDLSQSVECNGFDINEKPAVVVLCDECDQAQKESAEAALRPIAEEIAAAGKKLEDGPDLICFIGKSKDGPVGKVRNLTNITTSAPTLMILDIPDNGGFYISDATEITESSIRGFIEAFRSSSIASQRKQLG